MKKLLFAMAASCSSVVVQAQLTLEHTYSGIQQLHIVNLEDIGYRYACYDTLAKALRLFTPNHTSFKTIPISVPAGAIFGGISALSTKLIDVDASIEFAYMYYTGGTIPWTTIVQKENGTVLHTMPGVSGLQPVKVGTQWKVIAPSGYSAQVWAAPGSMPVASIAPPDGNNTEVSSAFYPNPMSTVATLQYKLPQGVYSGTVEVLNTNGQVLRSYNVGSQFNDILIERGELPSGTYLYRVNAGGTTQAAKQFVIQ